MAIKKVNFIVGLVVIVALIILIFGVFFLQNTKPFEKKDDYYAIFSRVSTLQINDPLKLNGVSMGRVKTIELHGYQVKVGFYLKKFFTKADGTIEEIKIPKNSEVIVQNIGLMGERQIEIRMGDSKDYYKPGDIIENTRFDAGIAEAMGLAGKAFEEAEKLVLNLQETFDSTIGNREFQLLFDTVVVNTQQITVKIKKMMKKIDPKLQSSLNNMERASIDLKNILDNEKGPVSEILQGGKELSDKAKELTNKVESIANDVSDLLKKIDSREGTLGSIINDPTFYTDIKSTIGNLDSLLLLIKKQGLDVNVDIF